MNVCVEGHYWIYTVIIFWIWVVNLLLDPRVFVFLYLYLFGISVASSTLRDTVVVASKSSSASSLSPSSQQPWQPLPLLPQYSVSHIVFQLVDVAPKSPAGFGRQQFATWFRWDFSLWRDHGNEDGAFAFLNLVAFLNHVVWYIFVRFIAWVAPPPSQQ